MPSLPFVMFKDFPQYLWGNYGGAWRDPQDVNRCWALIVNTANGGDTPSADNTRHNYQYVNKIHTGWGDLTNWIYLVDNCRFETVDDVTSFYQGGFKQLKYDEVYAEYVPVYTHVVFTTYNEVSRNNRYIGYIEVSGNQVTETLWVRSGRIFSCKVAR